jgi:hypothetical protein
MTASSCRQSLAAVVLAPRNRFQHNVIGNPTWVYRPVAVRVRRSAATLAHATYRGRPDLLFEEAATDREMYRL